MKISPRDLRDEGVINLGRIEDSSILFVLTRKGLHLLHASELPARKLDAWGARRVIERLDQGDGLDTVAREIGIGSESLRRDLLAAGWAPSGKRIMSAQRRRARERAARAIVAPSMEPTR